MTLHLKKKNYGGENIDTYMHACMHEGGEKWKNLLVPAQTASMASRSPNLESASLKSCHLTSRCRSTD